MTTFLKVLKYIGFIILLLVLSAMVVSLSAYLIIKNMYLEASLFIVGIIIANIIGYVVSKFLHRICIDKHNTLYADMDVNKSLRDLDDKVVSMLEIDKTGGVLNNKDVFDTINSCLNIISYMIAVNKEDKQ